MWEDPIVAEVRRVREAHAAQFNNDLLAIYRDLKARNRKAATGLCLIQLAVSPHQKNWSGQRTELDTAPT